MAKYDNAFNAAADIITGAERDTRTDIGKIKGQEENFTSKFFTRIQDRLDGVRTHGIQWNVYTFNPAKHDEGVHGIDGIVAINIDLDGKPVSKGFVVQAKFNKNKIKGVAVEDREKLERQCGKMLDRTDAAFVFAYGEENTKVVNASDVLKTHGAPLSSAPTQALRDFFSDVFECKKGSMSIVAKNPEELQSYARDLSVPRLMITARD